MIVTINITKESLTTKEIQEKLAVIFNCPNSDIGYAGLKDKHARTTQTFSVLLGNVDSDSINDKEAEKFGLVNKIVPNGKHVEGAIEFAEKITRKCRLAYNIGKPAFYTMGEMDYVKALHYAKDLFTLASTSEDTEEGMKSVLEKRSPVWKNR